MSNAEPDSGFFSEIIFEHIHLRLLFEKEQKMDRQRMEGIKVCTRLQPKTTQAIFCLSIIVFVFNKIKGGREGERESNNSMK